MWKAGKRVAPSGRSSCRPPQGHCTCRHQNVSTSAHEAKGLLPKPWMHHDPPMALVNAALSTLEHALVLGLRLCTITAQHMFIIVIKDPLHPVSAKQEGTRHPKATEIEFHTDSMPKYFSLLFTILSNPISCTDDY